MSAAEELVPLVGVARACDALGVSRATRYRRRTTAPPSPTPRKPPPRALSEHERQVVLDLLHAERFLDASPAQVYATLLDEGQYFCSVRTLYRLLHEHQEVRERRDQLRHPQYHKPQLLATAPRQVWSWDITKLLGPAKWTYYYLYTVLDIFSRYTVGWLLASRESADLARRLLRETIEKENVPEGQLTVHSDRGPAMKSQGVAQLLAALGVEKSHSRPHVSNDNPFSESQYKTLKYRPGFPDRFDSFEHARSFCQQFFDWYHHQHHHSGLGLLTPAVVHAGLADLVLQQRRATLQTAYAAHPERFVHQPPRPLPLPQSVWINPPVQTQDPTPQTDSALH